VAKQTAFAGACIEVFSRLWAQLESVAIADCVHGPADAARERRVEMVRLELIVLLDACRARRWQMLLDSDQRRTLERYVGEVLDSLTTQFDEAPLQALARAQNCLLDAVLEQHQSLDRGRVGRALRRATA
jgi:hypothetical protein